MSTLNSNEIENNITNDLPDKIAKLEEKARIVGERLSKQEHLEAELQSLADNMSLLGDTEQGLADMFLRNMNAFKIYLPDIYHQFVDYHANNYLINIVDGFVNIFDKNSNSNLYTYPPYLEEIHRVKYYQCNPISTQLKLYSDLVNQGGFMHVSNLNPIIQRLEKREAEYKNKPRNAPKVMNSLLIFGVGLGYHIDLLLGQHQVNNLYIVEPELDLFYSSLFVTNWAGLLNKLDKSNCDLYLSLGEQKESFFDDLHLKTYATGQYALAKAFAYIHNDSPEILTLVNDFKNRFREVNTSWGFFDDGVISISHLLENLTNKTPLFKKQAMINNVLADIPVFIVGNGPSLDELIDTIKAYQDQAIIISCGSTLSALYKYGIIPDIHCEQERTSPIAKQVECYCPSDILRTINFVAPATVHPDVFAKFNNKLMMLKDYEPASILAQGLSGIQGQTDNHKYINPTVANTALTAAISMGFKNIYFCGVDLGHKVGGSHHSKKSFYYNEAEIDLNFYHNTKKAVKLFEGNLSGQFVTDNFFELSRRMIEQLIQTTDDSCFFNLSDGIKIAGAMPLAKKELASHFDNKNKIDKNGEINQLFSQAKLMLNNTKVREELNSSLDLPGFEFLCDKLLLSASVQVNHCSDALTLLATQMQLLQGSYSNQNFYLLLNGSMLQMFSMLLRLLYESNDEKEALNDFKYGLGHYQGFLVAAPKYYRDNVLVAHEMTSGFHESLKSISQYNK